MASNQPTVRNVKLLPPDAVRFSQNTIGFNFKDGRSVEDLTNAIKRGKVNPQCDIPPIRAFETKNGNFVTHDNRRLKVFKDAGVAEVPVLLTNEKVPDFKFTTEDHGRSVQAVKGGGKDGKSKKGGVKGDAKGPVLTSTYTSVAPKGDNSNLVCHEIFTRTVRKGDTEITDKYERTTYVNSKGKGGQGGTVPLVKGGTKSLADAPQPNVEKKNSASGGKAGKGKASQGAGKSTNPGQKATDESSKLSSKISAVAKGGAGNGKGGKGNGKAGNKSQNKGSNDGGKNGSQKKG